jgi:hypothetical protein
MEKIIQFGSTLGKGKEVATKKMEDAFEKTRGGEANPPNSPAVSPTLEFPADASLPCSLAKVSSGRHSLAVASTSKVPTPVVAAEMYRLLPGR